MKLYSLLVTIAGILSACPSTRAVAQEVGRVPPELRLNETAHGSIQSRCSVIDQDVQEWWYQTKSNGPYTCTNIGDTNVWGMLNAYRAGGQEGVHWKYTNDANDGECLTNWKYYTSDGQTVLATIPRTTTMNDSRRWCALPVYRQGGVLGKQWAYCFCWFGRAAV